MSLDLTSDCEFNLTVPKEFVLSFFFLLIFLKYKLFNLSKTTVTGSLISQISK